jgi:hypothetical protein
MTKAMAVHWMGGVRVALRGGVRVALPHYPACCAGERAEQLANTVGAGTYVRHEVTCRTCIVLLEREQAGGAT